MPRFSAPIVSLASLVIVGIVAAGCASTGAAAAPRSSTAAAAPSHPTMNLKLSGGPGSGEYTTDTTSSLNACTHAADGSWRLLYAGGSPFVNLDLLIGPKAGQPGGAEQVAAEINAGPGYVRFDQALMRGGDAKGRSKASVTVASTADATTFTVKATTPNLSSNETVSTDVELTVTCPN